MKIDKSGKTHWHTIVIGGGQAGLVTGYFLQQANEDFIILDSNARTGNSWRKRWDTLKLFTPNWLNGLPGKPFGDRATFPTKDETADYLDDYRRYFNLPIQHNCTVTVLSWSSAGYRLQTSVGIMSATNVVIATGNYSTPKVPMFAGALNRSIVQLHSSAYKNVSQLPPGDVLVVGAGTSGLQIALDIVKGEHKVFVAGKPPNHIPDLIFKYFAKQFVWVATNILNTSTPMGRKMREATVERGKAAPLINITLNEVLKAGATHVDKIAGTDRGWPLPADGDNLKVSAIIWATGFLPDYTWVQIPGAIGEHGYPVANRGISTICKGLYFVGYAFQYGLTSAWLGGVGRDAQFVCDDLLSRHAGKPEK